MVNNNGNNDNNRNTQRECGRVSYREGSRKVESTSQIEKINIPRVSPSGVESSVGYDTVLFHKYH